MTPTTIELSVTELQQAVADYVRAAGFSQPTTVLVDNGFGKTVLLIPLKPGTVVCGAEFQRKTEET